MLISSLLLNLNVVIPITLLLYALLVRFGRYCDFLAALLKTLDSLCYYVSIIQVREEQPVVFFSRFFLGGLNSPLNCFLHGRYIVEAVGQRAT
jgi:hypothetical protein